jgi:hypothetical protein
MHSWLHFGLAMLGLVVFGAILTEFLDWLYWIDPSPSSPPLPSWRPQRWDFPLTSVAVPVSRVGLERGHLPAPLLVQPRLVDVLPTR